MTIKSAIYTYSLDPHSTLEDLEDRWGEAKISGEKVALSGYILDDEKTIYIGFTYEFLTEDHTSEGILGLRAASDPEFETEEEAIAWALQQ